MPAPSSESFVKRSCVSWERRISASCTSVRRCSSLRSRMPATWAAMARRKSTSPELNSRRSVLWTFSTPTRRGPDSMGTDAMEWKRSSSRPGTHFQCGSLLTSGTTAGRRDSATQPVIPSPTFIRTRPTMFSLRPFVAVSSNSSPDGSRRYRIADVVSRMISSSSSSGRWVEAAACASRTRKLSSRAARLESGTLLFTVSTTPWTKRYLV